MGAWVRGSKPADGALAPSHPKLPGLWPGAPTATLSLPPRGPNVKSRVAGAGQARSAPPVSAAACRSLHRMPRGGRGRKHRATGPPGPMRRRVSVSCSQRWPPPAVSAPRTHTAPAGVLRPGMCTHAHVSRVVACPRSPHTHARTHWRNRRAPRCSGVAPGGGAAPLFASRG